MLALFLRRLKRDEAAATAVEFALILPVLVVVLLSITEVGVLGFVSNNLDDAVGSAGRAIRTGRADGPSSADAFKDLVCSRMVDTLATCRSKLTISVEKYPDFATMAAAADTAPNGSFDKGQAGDIILVKANYRWPLNTPFVGQVFHHTGPTEILLDGRSAFKNEPYS
jgi:Flp pilus assembly protein TadG